MKLLKLEKYMCAACKRLSAYLEGNGLPHETVNIEDHPEVAAQYQVMAAPVLIALDEEGQEISRVEGYYPDQIQDMLDTL